MYCSEFKDLNDVKKKFKCKIEYFIKENNDIKLNYIITNKNRTVVRVFANVPGDLGSIPGRVIPKIQKMVLDASLLNTQHYMVRIKGKVEQSRERSNALPYTSV